MSRLVSCINSLLLLGLGVFVTIRSALSHPAAECDCAGQGADGSAVIRHRTPIYQHSDLASRTACDTLLDGGDQVFVDDERSGWSLVKVRDGSCSGRRGWVVTAHIDGGGPPQILVGTTISLQVEGTSLEPIIDGRANLVIRQVDRYGGVHLTVNLPSPYQPVLLKLTAGGRPVEFEYKSHRYRLILLDKADFANQAAGVRLDRVD